MAVILKCPGCRQKMKVADYFHGTMVACSSCAHPLEVPAHAYRDNTLCEQFEAALEEREILPTDEGRYAVNIRRNRRRSWHGSQMVIGSVVPQRLLVLALLASILLSAAYLVWRTPFLP